MKTIRTDEYRGYKINWYYDEHPVDPREWDNVAHFICWDRRYVIGDKHNYSNVHEFFAALCEELVSEQELMDYLIHNKIVYERERNGIREAVMEMDSIVFSLFPIPENQGLRDIIAPYELLDEISASDLRKLCERHAVIKTISKYEHCNVSIFFGSPTDPWDSGYVGYGYVTHQEAVEHLTAVDSDWREKAEKVLNDEMEVYADYASGQVYGYAIKDKDGNEIDNCCGVYGDKGIEWTLSECKATIDFDIKNKEEKQCDFWSCID